MLPCASTFSPSHVPRRPCPRNGLSNKVRPLATVPSGCTFVGHNSRVTRVADGDVEGLLVRREGNAVRPREVGNQQGYFALRIHAIDAVMWQLLQW